MQCNGANRCAMFLAQGEEKGEGGAMEGRETVGRDRRKLDAKKGTGGE